MTIDARTERLEHFVAFVRNHLRGDEKGESQVFLDRLFQAFGQPGTIEAGAVYEDRLKRPNRRGVNFADLTWKDVLLVEMKKRGEYLASHTQQMLDYWVQLAGRRPAFCVLCNFDEFWIYDFNKDILGPVDRVTLDDLPERFGALAFLFPTGESPVFGDDHEAVTREAADHLAFVFSSIVARGADHMMAQRFTLQLLVALFAEDIGLLERYFLARLLDDCTSPKAAYDLIGGLFTAMNTSGGVRGGRYVGVDYFNGGLFAKPAPVELEKSEIDRLKLAADADWSKVRPEIFGTIFEHSMDAEERHAFGAHFTSQLDILKIIKPTITDPWIRLINGADTLSELIALRERLRSVRVLDPACGSGNFLYLAYREMRRLQASIDRKRSELSRQKGSKGQQTFTGVSVKQFYGMDINPFAIELAKVTLMIAKKLATDELHDIEAPLPLDNLDANFRAADALIEYDDGGNARRPDWFPADIIIGNPPFLGAKRFKPVRGPEYVNAVRKLYPEVPGMADYCVYWIRRSHDHLPECTPDDPVAGRAGLVGTQNIRNNKSREGGLDHVVASGVITEAVDNQPWSGEANVHVSIANWIKTPDPASADDALIAGPRRLWFKADEPKQRGGKKRTRRTRADKTYTLTYRDTDEINAALSDKADVSQAQPLDSVRSPQRSFQGVKLGYDGFVIPTKVRQSWLADDPSLGDVVKPFLIGRDAVSGNGRPSRAVIDFAAMPMFESRRYGRAFAHLEAEVLPDVTAKMDEAKAANNGMLGARQEHLERWWQPWNVRQNMRAALAELPRFIACSQVTKRPIFVFFDPGICPDATLQVFAFDDDYSFGLLASIVHWAWFMEKCSKLKSDFRYTRRSVWDTFPWPQAPATKDVLAIAEASRAMRAVRAEHLPSMNNGLRELYASMETPGKHPLRNAHAALDEAVLKAYGFSAKKPILAQLLDLNLNVVAREKVGEPVTAPGIPQSYTDAGGDPADLITDDCVRTD